MGLTGAQVGERTGSSICWGADDLILFIHIQERINLEWPRRSLCCAAIANLR